MLEYFYKWLNHMNASPGDKYHESAKLVLLYWSSEYTEPFNLDKLYHEVMPLGSESAELLLASIQTFTNKEHYMCFDAAGWNFIEPWEVRKHPHVKRVRFTRDGMSIVTFE